MAVLVVTTILLAVVLVLGLIGDGSLNFYAAAEQRTARERDRAAARATRAGARAARRRSSRHTYPVRNRRLI